MYAIRSYYGLDIDRIDVRTDRDYVRELIRFFRTRERRQTL